MTISNLSDDIHDGPPETCRSCKSYAKEMTFITVTLIAINCAPRIVYRRPRASAGLTLTVATSMSGSAAGSIGFGGGGGSGIAHAVCGVARFRLSGVGVGPWVIVPLIAFPSAP